MIAGHELITVSSNHFSHDQQVWDALQYLKENHHENYLEIRVHLSAEYHCGEWVLYGATQDPEYGSWLCDAIEDTGIIEWWEGEPFVKNQAFIKMTEED